MTGVRTRLRAGLPPSLIAWLRAGREKLQTAKNHYVLQRSLEDRPAWRDAAAAVRVLFRRGKTILFFPERPVSPYTAYKLCAYLGYTITKDPKRRFDVAFKRGNRTFFDPAVLDQVPVDREKIINAGSVDISKQIVARTFAEVFGYPLEVDPVRYHGRIVEKSNVNGSHDGRVIQGPISLAEVRPGRVYQREINNATDHEGVLLDYRVPIHGDRIPLVGLKYRSVEGRFNEYTTLDYMDTKAAFTPEELQKIFAFSQEMGVDYGELDVLRNWEDGRIYIVDVNNTPGGTILCLPAEKRRSGFELMAESFDQLLETRSQV